MPMSYLEFLKRIGQPRILVVGDLMLDRYIWGNSERISPEAPIPILRADKQEVRLGGAASVASLLAGLGADVHVSGVVGDDADGRVLLTLLKEQDIHHAGVFADPSRPTTTKERLVGHTSGRRPHQLLRVDYELKSDVNVYDQERLLRFSRTCHPSFDAIVISDYDKGLCVPNFCQSLIEDATSANRPVVVDPARLPCFGKYHGCSVIKPNRTELELVSGSTIHTASDAMRAAHSLADSIAAESVVATLDEDGLVIISKDCESLFPTKRREICDITGAGDTVTAILALCEAAGVPCPVAGFLSNHAAGLQLESVGVGQLSATAVAAELDRQSQPLKKIFDRQSLLQNVAAHRESKRTVVFTNGCFDLLHEGHLKCLQESARLGDVLVVAINSDASIRRQKGASRPVLDEHVRATMLAALPHVDAISVFDTDTPLNLITDIRPDVLAKGGTYTMDQIVGRKIVESFGGRVVLTGTAPYASTSRAVANSRYLTV